jgi:ABC-2 type transport system permease protein
VRRYLRLLLAFAVSELQQQLAYRFELAFAIIQVLLTVGTSIGALLILTARATSLNGWSADELILILGVFHLITGVTDTIFTPSIQRLPEYIRRGTLDLVLTKPADAQIVVSVRTPRVLGLVEVAAGAAVLGVALLRLEASPDPLAAAWFVSSVGLGVLLLYSLLMTFGALSFWFVRSGELFVVVGTLREAGRFPLDMFPGWLRVVLSTIVPIGVAVTTPAELISGRQSLVGLLVMAMATAGALIGSRFLWHLGLRSYTGASS